LGVDLTFARLRFVRFDAFAEALRAGFFAMISVY
jgi:hypothetical protein